MARSNQKVVPEAKAALDKFKYEVANDIAVKNIFEQLISKATSYFLSFMQFFCFLFSFHLIH